jgi:tetratricopeptide (TPR) repeat protein
MIQRKFVSIFLILLGSAVACRSSEPNSQVFIPEEVKNLVGEAEKAFGKGDLGASESLYKKALEFSPDNGSILVSLAAVKTRRGKLDDSDALLRQALRLDLKNGSAWLLLGMNSLQQKRDDEAFASLAEAVLCNDRNPRAHNYLGIAAGRKAWKEVSEQELRRAIELDPDYADANFNLAVLYLGRTPPLIELAHRHYQQALDLGSPRDPIIEAQLSNANAIATPSPSPSPSSALPSLQP